MEYGLKNFFIKIKFKKIFKKTCLNESQKPLIIVRIVLQSNKISVYASDYSNKIDPIARGRNKVWPLLDSASPVPRHELPFWLNCII